MANANVRTCETCGQSGADPYYTKAIRDVREEDKHKQPRWMCKRHKPKKVVKAI